MPIDAALQHVVSIETNGRKMGAIAPPAWHARRTWAKPELTPPRNAICKPLRCAKQWRWPKRIPRVEAKNGIVAKMHSSPSRTDLPEIDIEMAVNGRPAGKPRRLIHRQMLRYDERVSRSLKFPPGYTLPDDETGRRLHDLLERLAAGKATAYYDNGLRVSRSIFHSRSAALLLSEKARVRMLVIMPYFFSAATNS